MSLPQWQSECTNIFPCIHCPVAVNESTTFCSAVNDITKHDPATFRQENMDILSQYFLYTMLLAQNSADEKKKGLRIGKDPRQVKRSRGEYPRKSKCWGRILEADILLIRVNIIPESSMLPQLL
jgi:hypothetical protein